MYALDRLMYALDRLMYDIWGLMYDPDKNETEPFSHIFGAGIDKLIR